MRASERAMWMADMEERLEAGSGLTALEAAWALPTREERAGPCAYLAWVDSLPEARRV